NILSLSSLRQREIEQLLDINSTDPYTGRDLISVYHRYVRTPSEDLLDPLIFHNSEDLKGMAYILPVLYYTDICSLKLSYVSHEIHSFEDYHGNPCKELLISCTHNLYIPKSFKTKHGQAILSIRPDNTALLRVPVYTGTLKLFYSNYKDYYYLPNEDFCIHRSAASGVDPSRRQPATKETCYTKYTGMFFPLGNQGTVPRSPSILPYFRETYESKELYIPYSEDTAEEQLKQLVEELKL
nr:ribonuclease H-like domain-containing protein [Lachnospiraceae bacterium]